MTAWGTLNQLVRDLYEEDEDETGVSREEVVEQAVRNGVAREDAEDAVDQLLKRGEIYRPDPNDDRLKPTTLRA